MESPPVPNRLLNFPLVEVRVDCKLCPRRGCYRLARLAATFGAEMDLDRLLAALAYDCPYWRSNPRKYEARCGVRYADLDHRPPRLEAAPSASRRYTPMGVTRVLTLADLPGPTVTIVCAPCRRRGVLSVARLIQRFGIKLPLPSVLLRVAVGCPELGEASPRCQAIYETPPT